MNDCSNVCLCIVCDVLTERLCHRPVLQQPLAKPRCLNVRATDHVTGKLSCSAWQALSGNDVNVIHMNAKLSVDRVRWGC